tara:strand:+ start:1106 stop:1339 length:234 start_codon:yes stop_codon:yes gene_type:complete
MAYEHKENKGSLFTNEKKDKDTHPDHTGQINVAGTLYNISAWDNKSKSGKKYFGLSVSIPKPKEEKKETSSQDELPF